MKTDYKQKIKGVVETILQAHNITHLNLNEWEDFDTFLKGDLSSFQHIEKQILYTYSQMLITQDASDKQLYFWIESI
jgi:hypothetical protein